jgi:hypothetical protein
MHILLIASLVALALILLALIKMTPDLIRYVKISRM